MEEDAWVADYFSVVGARNDGDLELLYPDRDSPELLKCVWEDAITDIMVIRTGKGEVCPEGYELIDRTPMDHDADLNHGSISSWGLQRAVHLAVRRQHVSKREDYIAEIQVVYRDSDELPASEGWEIVQTSASGKSANLNKGGEGALLAVRRAVRNLVDCPAAVCSVCVLLCNKGEHPPLGYRVIRKDLNRGKFGDMVHLAYQVGGALSTCRLPFRSMILDRYPEQDSTMFPFPGDQLPMFVYPKGMLLEQRSGRDTPKSSFFSFVFTNVDGRRTYTACLTFYEPIRPSAARRLTRKLFTCQPNDQRDPEAFDGAQATQGRMRMGLHGSVSVGGLSALSQSGGRSRSGTGSWSGLGRGDGTSWPCAFARGGAGTPPMTSTSWTKMSVATRAARFASAHERSPAQPSTAEIFSAPDTPDRRDNVVSSPRSRVADSIRGAKDSSSDDVRHRKSDAPFRDFRQHPLRTSTGEPKRVGEAKTSTNGSSVPPPALGDRDAGAHSSSKTAELDTRNAHDHESVQDGSGAYLSDAEYDLMCRREDRPCIFAPKTICVISRFPIYGVLRRFLRHLYAISLSRSGVPLERYISMFVSCIPMPPPGGCPFHVYLEPLEDHDPRRSRLKPLLLQVPPEAWLPLMDIDFTAPFRCLSVQSVLTVFALMLQEAKILFLSSRAELLTQVMEALRSLLFPLEWQSVYVPQLPYALAGYLECPGGFMIGMRLTRSELEKGTGGTATVVRDLGLEGVANAVNLDAGEVLLHSGRLADSMTMPMKRQNQFVSPRHAAEGPASGSSMQFAEEGKTSNFVLRGLRMFACNRRSEAKEPEGLNSFIVRDEETATPWLPDVLHGDLTMRLTRELLGRGGVRMGVQENLDQYESAFEFAPAPDRTDTFAREGDSTPQRAKFSNERPEQEGALRTGAEQVSERYRGDCSASDYPAEVDATVVVRDCFLSCMAELLGGICGSVHQSEKTRSRHSLRTKPLDELFDMTEFLDGMDCEARPFLQRLTSTQMFWVMVQQWLGSSTADNQLLFFEECAIAVKNRRAGAVVPCRDMRTTSSSEGDKKSEDNFIPLLDEVRLKRPDLYGLNSLILPGSTQFEGSRSTPLATPLLDRRQNQWESVSVKNTPCGRATSSSSEGTHADCTSLPSSKSTEKNGPQHAQGHAILSPSPSGERGDHHVSKKHMERLHLRGSFGPLVHTLHVDDAVTQDESKDAEFCQLCTGPAVVIPGPTVQGLVDSGEPSYFRYDDGWPTPLSRSLLHMPPDALPSVVLRLQLHATLRSASQLRTEERVVSADMSRGGKPWVSRVHSAEISVSQASDRPKSLQKPAKKDSAQVPGYQGEKRLWRRHGTGRMVYRDAQVYDGGWRQGRRHGHGSMHYGTANEYVGQWKLGRKNGRGKMTYPDGARYEGGWVDDQRQGDGIYFYSTGAVYEGGWHAGKMHGTGCYTSANGARYEGTYRRGQRCGHGKMAYYGGQIYVGEWRDGVRSGFGTYTAPDGSVFEGFYEEDLKHGAGALRGIGDESITCQRWEKGRLVTAGQSQICSDTPR